MGQRESHRYHKEKTVYELLMSEIKKSQDQERAKEVEGIIMDRMRKESLERHLVEMEKMDALVSYYESHK
jgi:hypothetical protein